MGTYGIHKPYRQTFRETLEKEFNREHHKIIDCSIVKRKVAYLACKVTPKNGSNPYVYALVCKLEFLPNTNEHYNFWYKPMEEEMGPYYFDCPKRILAQLSPTDNKVANEWRAICRGEEVSYD